AQDKPATSAYVKEETRKNRRYALLFVPSTELDAAVYDGHVRKKDEKKAVVIPVELEKPITIGVPPGKQDAVIDGLFLPPAAALKYTVEVEDENGNKATTPNCITTWRRFYYHVM